MTVVPKPLILEHDGMYLNLEFSEEGDSLAVWSRNSTDREYHLHDGRKRVVYVPALAIVWNTQDWTERSRFEDGSIQGLALHPEGRLMATSDSQCIKIVDVLSGRTLKTFPIERAEGMEFSADGNILAAGSMSMVDTNDTPAALLVDSQSGAVVHRLTKEADDRTVPWVTFLPDGKRLVGLSYEYDCSDRAHIWNVADGKKLATFDCWDGVAFDAGVNISPTGRFGYGTTEREAQIWELQGKSESNPRWTKRHSLTGHKYFVSGLALSSDETLLFTIGAEALTYKGDANTAFSVRFWDITSGQEIARCSIAGMCFCFDISPDGRLLATMSAQMKNYISPKPSEYRLTLWDIPSGHMRLSLTTPSRRTNLLYHNPQEMIFSPDGRWLAVSHTKHVEVWDVAQILEAY